MDAYLMINPSCIYQVFSIIIDLIINKLPTKYQKLTKVQEKIMKKIYKVAFS